MPKHSEDMRDGSAQQQGESRAGVASNQASLLSDYVAALEEFDSSLCEAVAVSQASAQRFAAPHIGYATHIFTRMCSHGIALIRAVPKSRWVRADFEHWDFSVGAGHTRAIVEGLLLFVYMTRAPADEQELKARINLMHLNDCTRRVEMLRGFGNSDSDLAGLLAQQQDLQNRLLANTFFNGLAASVQKDALSGKKLMFWSRAQQVENAGLDLDQFHAFWLHLSQYTHVLPFSFFRMEPNGRGTGLENSADQGFLTDGLRMATQSLSSATDIMVETFPDTAAARNGRQSRFSPGPLENAPVVEKQPLAEAIKQAVKVMSGS